jgi:predicted Zn finger-like uncharacterized protein
MALATTCPQCKTSFRVVPDQLKLRRGLVRCGVCHHVFSGIDSLRYVEDLPGQPVAAAPAALPPSLRREAASAEPGKAGPVEPEPREAEGREAEPIPPQPESERAEAEPPDTEPITREPESVEPEPLAPEPARTEAESLAPEPLEQESERAEPESIEPEPLEPEPEPLEPEPDRAAAEPLEPGPIPRDPEPVEPGPIPRKTDPLAPLQPRAREPAAAQAQAAAPASDDDETDAVDFFADERSARGFSSRGAAFGSVASVALAALLLLQLTIGGRDWLASRMPSLGPVLAAALAPLGLRVTPPQETGALTIESFELQPAAQDGLYAVGALLRNRTGHVVQWPALELSLLDDAGEVVVRRVLRPSDYLPDAAAAMREGVGPRAELPLRAAIEVREGAPTGYRVRLVAP